MKIGRGSRARISAEQKTFDKIKPATSVTSLRRAHSCRAVEDRFQAHVAQEIVQLSAAATCDKTKDQARDERIPRIATRFMSQA